MIEDECDDELPPIIVNSHINDVGEFTMPSADVLASQRARQEECERELKLLRELHVSENQQQDIGTLGEIRIMHSDSSGSEGESALAAAVDALRVQPGNNTTSPISVDIANLLSLLLQHLPKCESQFFKDYLEILKQGNTATAKYVTQEMLSGIEAALQSEHTIWDPASVLCCSAWLCAMCMGGSAPGLRLRRALHALLQHANNEQVQDLGRIMSETLHTPQLLLELSDAVQGAPGAPRNLAAHLVQFALDKEAEAESPYTRVQLAGRAAAGDLRGAGELCAALAHCARRTRTQRLAHRADQLKVAVGASKLQLLFRTNN